jgi:hypothetical protein
MDMNNSENGSFLRKKNKRYNKIETSIKSNLLDLVLSKKWLLKDAAKELNMNYSTAKTIMRKHRENKRLKLLENAKKAKEENEEACPQTREERDTCRIHCDIRKCCSTNDSKSPVNESKCIYSCGRLKVDSEQVNSIQIKVNQTQMVELSKIVESSLEAIKTNQQMTNLIFLMIVSNSNSANSQHFSELVTLLNPTKLGAV